MSALRGFLGVSGSVFHGVLKLVSLILYSVILRLVSVVDSTSMIHDCESDNFSVLVN